MIYFVVLLAAVVLFLLIVLWSCFEFRLEQRKSQRFESNI